MPGLKCQPAGDFKRAHWAGRGDIAERWRSPYPVGIAPVYMIERVVGVQSELEVQSLPDRKGLRQSGIQVDESGSVKRIHRGIPISVERRHGECVDVDARDDHLAAFRCIDGSDAIGTLGGLSGIRLILADG